jgi:GT2 family glycosyltransferase
MSLDVTVLIASHRRHLLPHALESSWCQEGVSLQVLVNYCEQPDNFHTAWNRLAEIARGRYLCILGDDDTLGEGYLRECVKTLDATGADIAYTDVRGAYRDGQGKVWESPTYRPPHQIGVEEMGRGNHIWQSSVVRAEAWRRVDGYDMALEYVHDWDFWVRVLKSGGKAVYVPGVSWTHYTHDGHRVTTSSNRERAFDAWYAKHPDLARFRVRQ